MPVKVHFFKTKVCPICGCSFDVTNINRTKTYCSEPCRVEGACRTYLKRSYVRYGVHISEVWNKTKGFCYYCGVKLPHWSLMGAFQIDHLKPMDCRKGDIANLVPACKICNVSKNCFYSPYEWKLRLIERGSLEMFYDKKRFLFYFETLTKHV